MAEPILAVDLGTTTSAAAIVAERRTALLRDPLTGGSSWPSTLCVTDAGTLVATAAERRKRAEPGRYLEGPRRLLDTHATLAFGGRELTGGQAVTAYLTAMAEEA